MSWIYRKGSQLIDAERLARQIGLQPGFELIQEKAHESYCIWFPRDGPIWGVVLPGRSTGRVRRISHARVRFPLQLRQLARAQQEQCRGSRTRDLPEGFARFRLVSTWHQFSRVDVPNPEEHFSKFTLNTRSTPDCGDRLGGRRPGAACNLHHS